MGEAIRDRDMTQYAIKTYNKTKCAWFYRKKDPRYVLSNMDTCMPIIYRDVEYASSEHLYQASKYSSDVICVPDNMSSKHTPYVRQRIIDTHSPMAAKLTQACAVSAGLVREDWYDVNIRNMQYVLELKLFNNPDFFGDALKDTAGMDIVEVSRNDGFWGCKPFSVVFLRGQNILGHLLMDVRDRLEDIIAGNFSEPENFMLR